MSRRQPHAPHAGGGGPAGCGERGGVGARLAGAAPRGAFGAGIEAAIERAPFAPTARTPAHSSSSCRLSVQRVTLPSGINCSHVGDVVRRVNSS